MKQLVIAVDCDDVIVETMPLVIQHYNQTYGTNLTLADAYTKDPTVWGVERYEDVVGRVNAYMEEHAESLKPMQYAIDALVELSQRHELHLITGRADLLQEATEKWIEQHLPGLFTGIQLTNYVVSDDQAHTLRSKLEICQQIKADILIDDHLHHAAQVAGGGITVLLFGAYPWNASDIILPSNVIRVKDWHDVLEYCETAAA